MGSRSIYCVLVALLAAALVLGVTTGWPGWWAIAAVLAVPATATLIAGALEEADRG